MDLYRLIYFGLLASYRIRCYLVRQLTPMGLGILGVLFVSGVVGLGSSQSMCHLIFFLALSLLSLGLISRQFIHYEFEGDRSLPRFGTVGELLQYPVLLKNLTAQPQAGLKMMETIPHEFPTFKEFLRIRDRFAMGREWRQYLAKRRPAIAPLKNLPVLTARLKTEVMGEILPLRRGRLGLAELTLACPDPLGLSYRRVSDFQAQSVCILPQRYQLPPFFSSNSRAYQMGDAVLLSSVGEAMEFRSLRDYRPGDPTNRIHWKSWAKVGRPIVKEQQDESAVHHALILDTFHPEPQSDEFEAILAIATSILTQEQTQTTALLDVMFADQTVRCLTVRPGLRQRSQLLEKLATMSPCQTLKFENLLPLVQSRLSRLSSCICVFLHWDETRNDLLEMLAQFGVPTKAIVLCENQLTYVGLRYLSIAPECTAHFVSLDQIQAGLDQI